MDAPFFSIIIPTLNEELFLPKLLDSLTQQSYRDFEVIIVDGGSKDKTVAVARSFEDKFIAFDCMKSARAHASTQRNIGAAHGAGEYLIFLDADIIAFPYALDRIAEYIAQKNPKILTMWFSPDSVVSGDIMFTLIGNMLVEGSLVAKRPVSPGGCTVVQKVFFQQIGGFDESIKLGEDLDLTRRAGEAGAPLHVIRETLVVYSLRRLRREGKAKMIQLYARGALLSLLTKRSLGNVPGYVMGGHLYNKKPRMKKRTSFTRSFERKIKSLTREIFE